MTQFIDKSYIQKILPSRHENSHKGTFGHVYIIAGSSSYIGAPKLCSIAAERSGTGLTTLAVPESIYPIIASSINNSIIQKLSETINGTFSVEALKNILNSLDGITALVLGPGIGRHPETTQFISELIRLSPIPLLLDADALNAVSENPYMLKEAKSQIIITPHPGEMARLTGQSTPEINKDRIKTATSFSTLYNCTVVLKGNQTVIAAPNMLTAVNTTGSHGLAKGGTGDVLSGLIGGLLAQHLSPFDAACIGTYIHGLAGDIAQNKNSARGMTAKDTAISISQAWKTLE